MEKLKVGELLAKGFGVLVKNPSLLILGLITELPLLLVDQTITAKDVAGFVLWLLLCPYFIALIVKFVYDSREKAPSWQELNRLALGRYFFILPMYLIYFGLTLVGTLLLVVPGIYLSVRLVMCDCGIILEKEGIRASLKRSWTMTKGSWWRLFAILLACYLPNILFSLCVKLIPVLVVIPLSLLLGAAVFVWFQSTFTLAYLRLKEIEKTAVSPATTG
jgi:hypothetical protein